MEIDFKTTNLFVREIKKLSNKYKSINEDVKKMALKLKDNPEPKQKSMGHGFYKIRLPIKSKKTGARGGGRLIIYVKTVMRNEKKIIYSFQYMINLRRKI